MLKTIIISSPITPVMANYIVNVKAPRRWDISLHSNIATYKPTYGNSADRALMDMGISQINVWFNTRKLVSESFGTKNCTLNVVLNPEHIGVGSLSDIVGEISSMVYPDYKNNVLKDFFVDLDFQVKSATFTYNFLGNPEQMSTYYTFLSGGYSLNQMHLQKTVKKKLAALPDLQTTDGEKTDLQTTDGEETDLQQTDGEETDLQTTDGEETDLQQTDGEETEDSKTQVSMFDEYTTDYSGIHDSTNEQTMFRYYEAMHITIKHFIKPTDNPHRPDMRKSDKEKHPVPDLYYYTGNQKINDLNRLNIKLNLKRNKIAYLQHVFTFDIKNLDIFMQHTSEIDSYVFSYYISNITGTGTFYKFKEAEKIIMATKMLTEKRRLTPTRKILMKAVLRGVASYKSISSFLDHTPNPKSKKPSSDSDESSSDSKKPSSDSKKFPCMEIIETRSTATRLLKEIQQLGIAPYNLSIRSPYSRLDSLINIVADNSHDLLPAELAAEQQADADNKQILDMTAQHT